MRVFDEKDQDLVNTMLRGPFGIFLLLSLLAHLALLLTYRLPTGSKESKREPIFVRVVDPEALLSLPQERETRLPPPKKSLNEFGQGETGILPAKRGSLPATFPPSASPLPSPSTRISVKEEAKHEEGGFILQHHKESPQIGKTTADTPPQVETGRPLLENPDQPGGKGAEGPFLVQPRPGLPFAETQDLNRLAKLFTDRIEPKRDSVSINTDDLKYVSYFLKLKNRIEFIWRYPPEAARQGIQGSLFMSFTIRQDGSLKDVEILTSSGVPMLDKAAIQAVKEASPYLPLPEVWHQDSLTVTGNFIYYSSFMSIY